MRLIGRVAVLSLVASSTFAIARLSAHLLVKSDPLALAAVTEEVATDSQLLARRGMAPGRQLVLYYFGGAGCGPCSSRDVLRAISMLRETLRTTYGSYYAATALVGVAIDKDVASGLAYLEKFDSGTFDEISTGRSWMNEHVTRLLWSDTAREMAVPRLVAIRRNMTGKLDPVDLRFSSDSIVKVVLGSRDIVQWIEGGAHLESSSINRRP